MEHSPSSSRNDIPEDIYSFMIDAGIEERRMEIFRRNVIHSFTNPSLIAEIIHHRYPKLVLMHQYLDGNSIQTRLANWRVLNGTLSKLRCNFLDEEIPQVAARSLSKDQLFVFLRFLKSKLDAFEPLYLAKSAKGETLPENKERRQSIITKIGTTFKAPSSSSASKSPRAPMPCNIHSEKEKPKM